MASALFGWELLYASVEKDIKNNQDILVCFVHLALVSNGFKCIGLGESKNVDGTETKTEALPKGWNDNYAIRYMYQGRLYNLRATSMDDAIMVNLIRVDERTVSMIQLNTRAVAQRTGSLDQMIPDNQSILENIRKQLIDKVVISSKSKETSSQTSPEQSSTATPRQPLSDPDSDLRIPPRINPVGPGYDPFRVGQDDLNPFGNPFRPAHPFAPPGGGGMLFQPPRAPPYDPDGNLGVPRGSIPPGARFDPFRPGGGRVPQRPSNPDSDEFPPPGFDDMYM